MADNGYVDPSFVSCPTEGCSERFASWQEVINHLDDPFLSCVPIPLVASDGNQYHIQEMLKNLPEGMPLSDNQGIHPPGFKFSYHPHSAYDYGRLPNILEEMNADKYASKRTHNVFWPFSSQKEWELAKFLMETLNQSQIDKFLKLAWTKDPSKLSFSSAYRLTSFIEVLPTGPVWKMEEIQAENYKTAKPMILLYRDGLEVVKSLFGNPVFARHMMLDPKRDQLPQGSTIVGIVGASDKTTVTRGTGGIDMHPTFLTLANIASDVHMKATSHSWLCTAFLPVPTFLDCRTEYQSVLSDRVWHTCMDIIMKNLKASAATGVWMSDPNGIARRAYTPLVAWVADLPEQQMIACTTKNLSPISHARLNEFGDNHPHRPRLGIDTLLAINSIQFDTWDFANYLPDAKVKGLSGVHQPFWRDWSLADPNKFLVPELLHTCHKFFFDHVLLWCKEAIGKDELDARYRSLHSRVGFKHFGSGISHVKQMTGREHREIQRTIVATAAGAVAPKFLRAVRALVDFIYQAQSPIHTPSSITAMVTSLSEFHDHKQAILDAEARRGASSTIDHFNIPKLELLQHFARAIRNMGAIMQFTADVTERLLITHCKHPFSGTNGRLFFEIQCVRILDRLEKARMFHLYAVLRHRKASLINYLVAEESSLLAEVDPESSWLSHTLPEEKRVFSIRPMRNHFLKGIRSVDAKTAFHLTKEPDMKSVSIKDAAEHFALDDLPGALAYYARGLRPGDGFSGPDDYNLPFTHIRVWYKCKIQLHSMFRSYLVMPAQTIQAYPPLPKMPLGNCDTVRLSGFDGRSFASAPILQVRIIFQAIAPKKTVLDQHLSPVLVYAQNFGFSGGRRDSNGSVAVEEDVDMYVVERLFHNRITASGERLRMGSIYPLNTIHLPVDLIPVFGAVMDRNITASNSLEIPTMFYVNNFSDKETYNTFLTEFTE
ncbi:hypothetical protein SERLA73DRAFT_74942 [Serpula lacrymans var. lacrymans S7.3]|uniref:DUF6830 domain-containing protein n=1 Tax=Serpula lacrymans var. lacrymans (strain S7.3) TaxID=936435 RepID=F8Q220_SERL3|nr:hypothetical protein SERLA73DRAFT_74942 [Serpula lacrymans var. lacrymans S7.3]